MFGPNFFGSFHSESCAKFFRGEAEAHPAARAAGADAERARSQARLREPTGGIQGAAERPEEE